MDQRVDQRYELNEVGWWEQWTSVTWLTTRTYVMLSSAFPEPFFNRAGFIAPESDESKTLSTIESIFNRRNLSSYIFAPETIAFRNMISTLNARGYVTTDEMSVMVMRQPSFRVNNEIQVEVTRREDAEEWCKAYLESFYGDLKLLKSVLRIVQRNMKEKKVRFVSAKYAESTVGTLAAYDNQKVMGIYCVGTIPEFRRKRVANTMMKFAQTLARDAGSALILQTMLSDGVEDMYLKMGLVRAYVKKVFAHPIHS